MASIGEILLNTLSAGKCFSSFFYPHSHRTLSHFGNHPPLLARLPLDSDAFLDLQLEHINQVPATPPRPSCNHKQTTQRAQYYPCLFVSTTLALPLVIITRNTLTLLDRVLLFWLMTSLRNVDSAGVSKGVKDTLDLTTTITSRTTLQSRPWSCSSSFPPVLPEVNNEEANASSPSICYCVLDQQIRESATTHLETAANEDFVRTQAPRLFSIVLSSHLHTYHTLPLFASCPLFFTCSALQQSRDTYCAKGQEVEKVLEHSKEQGVQRQQDSKDTGNSGKE